MKRILSSLIAVLALAACGAPAPPAGLPATQPAVPATVAAAEQASPQPPGQPQGPAGGGQPQPGGAGVGQNSAGGGSVVSGPTLEPYAIDLAHLPIGDSRLSTQPQQGYLWQCDSPGTGGGAMATGAWFNLASGTWDLSLKPIIDGSVNWPHQLSIQVEGDTRVITGNDLPDHPTGVYPVSASDDAYKYDRNPNRISAQSISLRLPANPTVNAQPSCVHQGIAGILLTGSVFYDATDAGNRDAVAHEIQDSCAGHPQMNGEYHYHSVSPCVKDEGTGHSALVGYAADGFGIFGHRGEDGQILTDADLDECHGHTHAIEWDGQTVVMYHYHATYEYPYTVGCYRGTSSISNPRQAPGGSQGGGPAGGQGGGPGGGPPPGGGNPPPPR